MADEDSEYKYECDYERLVELNEQATRLEEEIRQLNERVEKAEKMRLKCMITDATLIALLLAFIMITILQLLH